MAQQTNLDLAINALVLIRNAQRAIDAALRLPAEDRAAVAEQVESVRKSAGQVAGSLAATIPGAQSLAGAGQVVGEGLAQRTEFRALTGMVASSHARARRPSAPSPASPRRSAAGATAPSRCRRGSRSGSKSGVATREDLARELAVDPRSPEFQDALERTLGTGRAEWYGSGTYGLPHGELEAMISRAREASAKADEAPDAADDAPQAEHPPIAPLGNAIDELNSSLDELSDAVASTSTSASASS